MGRLILLLFVLPWWAYVPGSLGVFWLGERVYQSALADEAEKAAALAGSVPEAVDLAVFDKTRDIHAAGEVHVTGWIDTDLNYELVKRTNGVPTSTRHLYMMFGTDDPKGSTEVRAALMLTREQRETFIERLDDFATGFTPGGAFIFAFNGFADTSAMLDGMAADAIAEQGLTRAADFIYVEPFFDGRAAALGPHGVPDQTRHIGWVVAALVALIGVVKRVQSVRARPAHAAAAAEAAEVADLPGLRPAAAITLPGSVDPNTPLGRLARRRAAETSPPAPVAPVEDDAVEAAAAAMTADADDVPDADRFDFARPDPSRRPHGHGGVRRLGAESRSRLVYDSDRPKPDARFGDPMPAAAAAVGAAPETVGRKAQDMPALADETGAGAKPRSDAGFYVRLVIAMLVVGGIAYRPAVVPMALPFIGVALFWFGVYVAYRKVRSGARRLADKAALDHAHRREHGAQPVAVGAGGRFDIASRFGASGTRERRAG